MTYENAVFVWIGDLLEADTALMENLPGGVHRGLAPEDTQRPFVTLSHRGGAPMNAASAIGVQEVTLAVAIESVDGDQDEESEAAAERVEQLLSHVRGASGAYRFRCVPSGSLPDIPTPQPATRYFRKQGRLWVVKVSSTT